MSDRFKTIRLTDNATGMSVDLNPYHIYYVRISEKMGATVVVSVAGAFLACKEPKDEVVKLWQEAVDGKPEVPAGAETSQTPTGQ